MVSRRIALSLWLRHYWQKAEYNSFYSLNENGGLIPDPEYNFEHNYNYNSFNIDFVMGWEFAPGSMLSIVWKNAIEREDDNFNIKFFDNLHNLYDSPQLNMFSIKILYHLDYLQLKRKKHESANH